MGDGRDQGALNKAVACTDQGDMLFTVLVCVTSIARSCTLGLCRLFVAGRFVHPAD